MENSDKGVDLVKAALDCRYRYIDTAQGYYNEEAIGKAVRTSRIERVDFPIGNTGML